MADTHGTTIEEVDELEGERIEIGGRKGTIVSTGEPGIQDLVIVDFDNRQKNGKYAKDGFARGLDNNGINVIED